MSAVIVRPGILQHVCKEPLADIRSVQLRGRGITRLVGLDVCPKLTSLDISWNALTELDSACFEGCKELWIVDASHNRLESLGGLSSFMALGYLNLSSNSLPLESLRPLARAHVLELFLGSGRSTHERRRTLGLLPNLWALDDEFVTAKERRVAEDDYSRGGRERSDHLLLACNESSLLDKSEELRNDGPPGIVSRKEVHISRQPPHQQKKGLSSGSGFGGLETQGHQVREFYENIMWKLPSRTDAADSFRLATLLERYDQRAAAANTSAWLGSFTSRGVGGGGARGCVRRDWSLPLPRPHLEALMSLPLELKLDVAVLLAARATFRKNIPQQVLAEAFMVLLVPQGGLPDCIHNDLSRVPAFICTALVHALRSSIFRLLDQDSMPGHANTTARPSLDRQQTDLLEALPPVVTGVDFDNVFELWEISSRCTKGLARRGEGEATPAGFAGNSDEGVDGNAAEESVDGGCDVLPRVDLGSVPNAAVAAAAAAAAAVVETSVPSVSTNPGFREAYMPPLGVGLTRLCRRAVILLTRSPACPDLVAWQTDPAKQRTYHEMEPLLARANMAYRDLHPRSSFGDEVGGHARNVELARSSFLSSRQQSPSTPTLEFDRSPAAGENGGRIGGADGRQRQDMAHQHEASVDSFWSAKVRRPKAGERVQVLHDIWSVIVTVHPDVFSVRVAPFDGMQAPPYRGESHIDPRNLCYDPRGWWRHAPAVTTNVPVGAGRLHRLARGLSTSGLPWGAGSLNEPLEEGELEGLSQILRRCSSSGGGRETSGWPSSQNSTTDLLLNQETRQEIPPAPAEAASSCEKRAPTTAVPWPSTTKPSTVCTLGASLAPVVFRQARRPKNKVVDVFSAEGSWDPVFVVAPPRLVGLQNQAAARTRGRRRARQVAWHRIDGPEASVAPRPMMPRCSSLPAPAEGGDTRPPFLQQPTSIRSNPGLSNNDRSRPRSAAVAPSHGGSSSAYTGFIQPRSLSVPSINTPGSCSVDYTAVSADNAWLDLQREMGSLKADNRMFLRGSRGISAHALRTSESAVSVLTKSLAENSTVCAEATTDLLAKTLSVGLDGPAPVWKGDRPEDTPTKVFELTQVGGGPEGSTESVTVATCVSARLEAEAPTTERMRMEKAQQITAPLKGSTAEGGGGGGGGENIILPDDTNTSRRRRRTRGDGDPTTKNTTSGKWKPYVNRPLEWFPVPGRQVFRVDPNDVKAAIAAAAAAAAAEPAAEQAAVAETAGQADESCLSDRVDFMPAGQGAAGGGGSGNNGDIQSVGGAGYTEHRREEREEPQEKEERGEIKRRKNPGGGGQRGPGSGGECGTQSSARSEVSLSTRSAFPSAAVLVDLLPSPTTDNKAGARAKVWAGNRRPRPHAGCAGRGRGSQTANAPPGGVSPRKSSSAAIELLASHSKQKWSETMAGEALFGGNHQPPEAYHRVAASTALSAHGDGATRPSGMPENGLRIPPSPNERRGRGGRGGGRVVGAGGGGRIEDDVFGPRRQQGAAAAATNNPLTNREGGLQTNRLRLRPKARATVAPRLLREKNHPSRGVPQQQREVISGWEGEKASTVTGTHDNRTSSRFSPQGRGIQSSVKIRPTSPRQSDNALDECFSICSTANSSNNSCCGWKRQATPKIREEVICDGDFGHPNAM